LKDEIRSTALDSKELKENENYDLVIRRLLLNFKEELELWNFLRKNFDTLNNIKDWSIYRRAAEVSVEPTKRPRETNNEALMLLQGERVDEFNRRRAAEFQQLDLVGANLRKADLQGADLVGAIHRG
jgi:uncharacterized protein YjbI with pentapeptide repeats